MGHRSLNGLFPGRRRISITMIEQTRQVARTKTIVDLYTKLSYLFVLATSFLMLHFRVVLMNCLYPQHLNTFFFPDVLLSGCEKYLLIINFGFHSGEYNI